MSWGAYCWYWCLWCQSVCLSVCHAAQLDFTVFTVEQINMLFGVNTLTCSKNIVLAAVPATPQQEGDSVQPLPAYLGLSFTRSPGGAKKWKRVCKYLPLLSCVLCYIMCLIVVSVCTIVNLWHWVSLAPLFGSVYITVLNCVCYVMFIWWFVLYYMHCPTWQILCNPAFMLQYKWNGYYKASASYQHCISVDSQTWQQPTSLHRH